MSNFAFLQPEWPEVFAAASRAEALVYPDPRAACFYARRALEFAVQWLYKAERALTLPYQDNLAALLAEPSFAALATPRIATKTRLIKDLGNRAVHTQKVITQYDALTATRELFQFTYWLAHRYARGARPAAELAFQDPLPPAPSATPAIPPLTQKKLEELANSLAEKDEKLSDILKKNAALDEEILRLRAEVAAATAANEIRDGAAPDAHDYNEAETRDAFIDLLLREAGWEIDPAGSAFASPKATREFPLKGMPNKTGEGFADYVLWGEDAKPLAVVEAKRTKRDADEGRQQAMLYADCLEKQLGQRPLIFYTNGYEHWLWDDAFYPPRPVQGFYTRDELKLAIDRRATRKPLDAVATDTAISERYYQERAIRKVAAALESKQRKALLVMATGSGKTRAAIALTDVLQRANWVKRALFLADRNALVTQALGNFKKFLPASSPVNLVTERDQDGRVYLSTYQTMMGLVDELKGGQKRFGPGYFDLIFIDEAHRSIYRKFGAIFDYFDSLLVGLTATPKDEVDKNTYRLFELENGVPTDEYSLEQAVKDGYLVPPEARKVPLKFVREGIKYNDLSDEEKAEWDELEWDEDGTVPAEVNAEAVNRWLFNEDTVDKVLEHLMTHGHKVAGGDRLGKTIVFAKNHDHAEFIARRFDANYPHYAGQFARVIDFQVEYAQSLIDKFSVAEKSPHIAISVDMLDTGIDVPEVVNLVFFKVVRSKTKFWQMVGRGTRLCPEVFGPGRHKQNFKIFDFCGNLEFFNQPLPAVEGGSSPGLSERLFGLRVELIAELDAATQREANDGWSGLRSATATLLRAQVAAMPLDNFLVRNKRRLVERYSDASAWEAIGVPERGELIGEVAGLPSGLADSDLDAKQFDLLLLGLQLAILRVEPRFDALKESVIEIASALEEKQAIPMVRDQILLIQDVQRTQFWQSVTVAELEQVRVKLRALVKFIEKHRRDPVYTNFEDDMRAPELIALRGVSAGVDTERFREKALAFLKDKLEEPALHKVRWNEPLTAADLASLEAMLVEAGIGTSEQVREVAQRETRIENGLGLFLRSLVGLDRAAATRAFDSFVAERQLNGSQLDFVKLVIDHLTQCGWMRPEQLYSSPFTDEFSGGPNSVFAEHQAVQALISTLSAVERNATGAAVPE